MAVISAAGVVRHEHPSTFVPKPSDFPTSEATSTLSGPALPHNHGPGNTILKSHKAKLTFSLDGSGL